MTNQPTRLRKPAELEASRLRARRRRRMLLGWPPERWDDPPRARPRPVGSQCSVAIPDLDSHPLIDAAIASLRGWERDEIRRGMDSCALDLVGVYVLASVAGGDPDEAVRRERARYRHDRAALVYGIVAVTGLSR